MIQNRIARDKEYPGTQHRKPSLNFVFRDDVTSRLHFPEKGACSGSFLQSGSWNHIDSECLPPPY